jgi:AcrR family transcriptional regulator
MPRISASTLVEHRAQRRDALVESAARLLRDHGTISVSAVAEDVGLSRSAVYEYYSSAADLIADVLVDEMVLWADTLAEALESTDGDPVRVWIDTVISYAADGRHAFVRAAGRVPLPAVRRAQVQAVHRGLLDPLVRALGGDRRAIRSAQYVWGVTESAMNAVDAGADPHVQADLAWCFCQAGLQRINAG